MKNQRIATSKFLSKRRQNVPSNPEYRSPGSSSIKELWRHFDEKQGKKDGVRVEKQVNVKGYVSVQV
jgi:hypothetical protein